MVPDPEQRLAARDTVHLDIEPQIAEEADAGGDGVAPGDVGDDGLPTAGVGLDRQGEGAVGGLGCGPPPTCTRGILGVAAPTGGAVILLFSAMTASLGCFSTPPDNGRPTRPDREADDGGAEDTGDDADHTGDTADSDTGADTQDSGTDTEDSGDPEDTAVEPEPCPDGLVCVTTFPYEHIGTTVSATLDDFDSYGCAASTDESGAEVLYRVDVPEDGFLALSLSDQSTGADIDVHLLASRDAGDCIDRGHELAGSLVEAGRYWVVADTWVSSGGDEKDGAYTLTFGLSTVPGLEAEGLGAEFADDALYAFDVAWGNGDADRFQYAITDFSLLSSEQRLWLLDLTDGSVLAELYVPHGEGSSSVDSAEADTFSNTDNSHQSSLGMMRGAEEYSGTYGASMRLDGLEPGYNDNVRDRAIVVHPWEGSRAEYVSRWGETAETWGCPAIDDRLSADVIDVLADGGLLFFWYPDADWRRGSGYLP